MKPCLESISTPLSVDKTGDILGKEKTRQVAGLSVWWILMVGILAVAVSNKLIRMIYAHWAILPMLRMRCFDYFVACILPRKHFVSANHLKLFWTQSRLVGGCWVTHLRSPFGWLKKEQTTYLASVIQYIMKSIEICTSHSHAMMHRLWMHVFLLVLLPIQTMREHHLWGLMLFWKHPVWGDNVELLQT